MSKETVASAKVLKCTVLANLLNVNMQKLKKLNVRSTLFAHN